MFRIVGDRKPAYKYVLNGEKLLEALRITPKVVAQKWLCAGNLGTDTIARADLVLNV